MLEILAGALLGIGILFTWAGALGLLRFPDFHTRLHAAGVTETLGMGATLTGLMLHAGLGQAALKLMLLGLFLFATGPIASHALAAAARYAGLRPPAEDLGSSPSC